MPEKKPIIVAGELVTVLESLAAVNGTTVATELRRAISLRKFLNNKVVAGATINIEVKGKSAKLDYK